jgi:hypothetical protein
VHALVGRPEQQVQKLFGLWLHGGSMSDGQGAGN